VCATLYVAFRYLIMSALSNRVVPARSCAGCFVARAGVRRGELSLVLFLCVRTRNSTSVWVEQERNLDESEGLARGGEHGAKPLVEDLGIWEAQ
jgi:hypothetical protein